MVEASHARFSVVRQCALLGISRSGHCYRPTGESAATLALMRLPEARASSGIDEAFLECPYYGSRQMVRHLRRLGHRVGRARVVRLMRKMGLAAIYQKPNTSAPHPEHRVYPYLLRDLAIVRPNQVWCSDITYIAMSGEPLGSARRGLPVPRGRGRVRAAAPVPSPPSPVYGRLSGYRPGRPVPSSSRWHCCGRHCQRPSCRRAPPGPSGQTAA
jgi:hypothetical protein